MKYIVGVREVWVQYFEVEACSEQDAINLVDQEDGKVLEDLFEYSHRLNPDKWIAEKGE